MEGTLLAFHYTYLLLLLGVNKKYLLEFCLLFLFILPGFWFSKYLSYLGVKDKSFHQFFVTWREINFKISLKYFHNFQSKLKK